MEAVRQWERGVGPAPSSVVLMIQRLPDDSLTVALVNGGRHLFGYTPARARMDDLFDAMNINTRATGMWDKKPPDFPLAPRPYEKPSSSEGETAQRKPKVSVRDLYFGSFAGMTGGRA